MAERPFATKPMPETSPGLAVIGEEEKAEVLDVLNARSPFRFYGPDVQKKTEQLETLLCEMKMALKKLKVLERVGAADELDLDASIDKTCRDGGEIDLVFRPERKNRFKLLLLMDAGGSMDSYADLVSRIFSAASQMSHFKQFRYYYFHNCVYEEVFTDMELDERSATGKLLSDLESDWRVIFVGDAAMSPYELAAKYGAIYYYHRNEQPGLWWLKRFVHHFRKVVWLNPMPERFWMGQSIQMIRKLFPMYTLTLDGLEEAINALR